MQSDPAAQIDADTESEEGSLALHALRSLVQLREKQMQKQVERGTDAEMETEATNKGKDAQRAGQTAKKRRGKQARKARRDRYPALAFCATLCLCLCVFLTACSLRLRAVQPLPGPLPQSDEHIALSPHKPDLPCSVCQALSRPQTQAQTQTETTQTARTRADAHRHERHSNATAEVSRSFPRCVILHHARAAH